MTTYAVVNGKGGVGKSTTSAEVVAAIVRAGRSACAIDLDQQSNLTSRLGVNGNTGGLTYDAAAVIRGDADLVEAAIPAPTVPGAHIVVGSHKITTVTPQEVPDMVTGLRDLIRMSSDLPFDDIVLDCPPSLAGTTLTALAAADVVIGVSTCEDDAVEQLERLEGLVGGVIARRIRPGAAVDWIVPTKFDGRTRTDRDALEDLRRKWGEKVTNPIRRAVSVVEAYKAHQPVSLYKPRAEVSADYIDAIGPIIRTHSTKEFSDA